MGLDHNVLSFLLLLLCVCSPLSSDGMSYVEGRSGRLLRALPGVRPALGPCDIVCDSFKGGGVVAGAICVCGGFRGSGTIASRAGSDGSANGLPNENPKFTSLALRVLFSVRIYVMVSRGRGKARTQLRAVAFAAAPLALPMVSDDSTEIKDIKYILASIMEERRQKRRVVLLVEEQRHQLRSEPRRSRPIHFCPDFSALSTSFELHHFNTLLFPAQYSKWVGFGVTAKMILSRSSSRGFATILSRRSPTNTCPVLM
jgi:hypothetical protein